MEAWRRTYWAVWVANFVTAVGMQSFLPFFPGHLRLLGVEDPDALAAWSGVVYGAAPLSAALMAPLWGSLGDRVGRRAMVLRAMLAIAVFVGLMALARTPGELLALRILQGLFSGFLAPSMTLVSVSAPAERQGAISGSLQMAMASGSIVGPVIGGLVRAAAGVREVYFGVSAAALLSALLVAVLASEPPTAVPARARSLAPSAVLGAAVEDLRGMARLPILRAALIVLFVVQLGMGSTNPLLELYVEDLWTGDPDLVPMWTGAAFSAAAVANVVAMPLWGRSGDRRGHGPMLVRCAVWSALALLLHALVPGAGALIAVRAILGAGTAGTGPLAFGVAAAETSVDRRGGAFGVVFSARALALAVAASLGGAASALVGIRGLYALGGLLVLGAAWGARAAVRGLPARPPGSPDRPDGDRVLHNR